MSAVQKTGAAFDRGSSKQDYATPRDFLDAVVRRFGPLCWDLAADESNAVATGYYGSGGVREDALSVDWTRANGVTLWLNPPFGNIAPWAEKCATCRDRSAWLLFLVPASVGSNWFQQHVVPNAHVLELAPRLCFDGKNSFPKDLVLACFGFGLVGRGFWRWK